MKPQKIILLLLIPILVFSFSNFVKADSKELFGYAYSETVGWISLNCANTNSCSTISYKVSQDARGKLSGYGFSQNGEWINFNPNFGGVKNNSDSTISGWVYGQTSQWINFDSEKVILVGDLQNEISSAKDVVNSNDLSSASTMSLLNSLCNQFLTSSECSLIK